MRYRSTRGGADDRDFADVLVEGLAPDGGLYVPREYPPIELPGDGYAAVAAAAIRPYVEPDPIAAEMTQLCEDVYGRFRHPEVAPVRQVDEQTWVMELFWGPTFSFKDYALQLVGAMFDRVLGRQDRRMLVLGATSGDTGSAAIDACRGRNGLDIVILFPENGVTEMQRRQMTTVDYPNVVAVAVAGTFDDCQRLVKQAFGAWRDRYPLGAINSINWARVLAQTAYYHHLARIAGERTVIVPTGNFGNLLSAHVARRGGAPLGRLVVANNSNRGLVELIETGTLRVGRVARTLAPAMDIQVPSNLERYLYELAGNDPERMRSLQRALADEGSLTLSAAEHRRLRAELTGAWRSDEDILATIRRVAIRTGEIVDPHTAVAWSVAEQIPGERVIVSTAHPAKFAEAVRRATGSPPPLPESLAALTDLPERVVRISPELSELDGVLSRIVG